METGFTAGSMMWMKVWKELAPSMVAASFSSCGREEKLPVEEDIVGAAAQYGRNDQGPVGIHHPHLEVQQVLGNQRYLGRQHHGRHQAGIPELGSGGREFGKTVSYHCGREHGCNRVDQDKKDGIFREQSEISHLEAVAEIGEQPSFRDESRGKE